MSDGVRISTTLLKPKGQDPNLKYPVLLEMQPYRKDDLFLARDYSLHSFFARHGYVMIKADVRGTGSSTGPIPDREYSDREISDAVELIHHYAHTPWSNGKVGMWGISWSGFNALQTAMRNPRGLKAVIAAYASDDLFHAESLRGQYQRLTTPVLLIGGLLDGYRDTIARLLDFSAGPVKAMLGPWNHSWPNMAQPCPCFEWRDEALKWWDFYLKDQGAPPRDRQLHVFQRAGDAPDAELQQFSGSWHAVQWNERVKSAKDLFLSSRGRLTAEVEPRTGVVGVPYVASNGRASGFWWGDLTPNMSDDDTSRVTFDSEPLLEKVELMGVAELQWDARTSQRWATWSVQLEDVFPDGRVALVTGAVKNSAQDISRTEPRGSTPHAMIHHSLPLHFSTWTFHSGHRIRVTVSHSQFPMVWPLPFHVSSQVVTGVKQSVLRLPLLPAGDPVDHQLDNPPRAVETYPGVRNEISRWPYESRVERSPEGKLKVLWKADSRFEIDGREHYVFEETTHATHDDQPWHSQFIGRAGHTLRWPGRELRFSTDILVNSDKRFFHVTFTRNAFENGVSRRTKTWRESIPRRYH